MQVILICFVDFYPASSYRFHIAIFDNDNTSVDVCSHLRPVFDT
jgi:hypothetical protein